MVLVMLATVIKMDLLVVAAAAAVAAAVVAVVNSVQLL